MYFGGKGSDVVAMLIELEMRRSFLRGMSSWREIRTHLSLGKTR